MLFEVRYTTERTCFQAHGGKGHARIGRERHPSRRREGERRDVREIGCPAENAQDDDRVDCHAVQPGRQIQEPEVTDPARRKTLFVTEERQPADASVSFTLNPLLVSIWPLYVIVQLPTIT